MADQPPVSLRARTDADADVLFLLASELGTAAIEQVTAFAFVRRNLRRLHLEAIASNVGAIRAYEKAGFAEEGRQREHAWVRGGYQDIVRMGLLRSEWQLARG